MNTRTFINGERVSIVYYDKRWLERSAYAVEHYGWVMFRHILLLP